MNDKTIPKGGSNLTRKNLSIRSKFCLKEKNCFKRSRVETSTDDRWLMMVLLYFFAYKTVFFSFQNNPKNLDPSYKTDLDLWDCLGRVKPI